MKDTQLSPFSLLPQPRAGGGRLQPRGAEFQVLSDRDQNQYLMNNGALFPLISKG